MSKNKHDSSSCSNDNFHTEKVFVSNKKSGLVSNKEPKNGFMVGRKFNETITNNEFETNKEKDFEKQENQFVPCVNTYSQTLSEEDSESSSTELIENTTQSSNSDDTDDDHVSTFSKLSLNQGNKDQQLPSEGSSCESDYTVSQPSKQFPINNIPFFEEEKNIMLREEIKYLRDRITQLINEKVNLDFEVKTLKLEKEKLLENIDLLNEKLFNLSFIQPKKNISDKVDFDKMSFMSSPVSEEQQKRKNEPIKSSIFESTQITKFDQFFTGDTTQNNFVETGRDILSKNQKVCPTPGCDGNGNINPNRSRHYKVKYCPLAFQKKEQKARKKSTKEVVNFDQNLNNIISLKNCELEKVKSELNQYMLHANKLRDENITLKNEKSFFQNTQSNLLKSQISSLKSVEQDLRIKVKELEDRLKFVNNEYQKNLEFKNQEISDLKALIDCKNGIIKACQKEISDCRNFRSSENLLFKKEDNYTEQLKGSLTKSVEENFQKSDEKPIIQLTNGLQQCPYCEICEHPLQNQERCSGVRRKLESLKVLAYGINNVLAENLEHKVTCDECHQCPSTSKSVLTQIKYEAKHQYRISVDFFYDALASKQVFDILSESGNTVKGFIQEIIRNPFGLTLFSDIQLKIWKKIYQYNPVLYFDATGSIVRDIKGQKKPFLYSMVAHDTNSKQIIPIVEFITTLHTTSNISKFILTIKHFFKDSNLTLLPKVVVTDFSWPLIKSVLEIYNKMAVIDYLIWSYDLINEPINGCNIECVIYLCATHFLKNIVKQANKTNANEKAKKALIFSFTLLQNSQTLKQIENYLINIYNIFNSRYLDETTCFSIGLIKDEILFRRLDKTNVILTDDEVEKESVSYHFQRNNANFQETEDSLIRLSPFSKHFKLFLCKIAASIDLAKDNSKLGKRYEENEYFSLELFEIIKKQLHLIPLWSGIVVSVFQDKHKKLFSNKKNRFTNNPVENWFMNLKNFIILNDKKYISEYTSLVYKSLRKKIFSGFFDEEDNDKKSNLNFKSLNSRKEIWRRKLDVKKREKGFYYKRLKNLGSFEFEFNDETELNNSSEFISVFDVLKNNSFHTRDDFYHVVNDIFNLYESISYQNSIEKLNEEFKKKRSSLIKLVEVMRRRIPSCLKNFSFSKDYSFRSLLDAHGLFECNAYVVNGDGNCFYYSISSIIFDNPDLFKLIKMGSIFILLEYKDFFEIILNEKAYDENFNDFIMNLAVLNAWANELIMLATSILLERGLICFCLNEANKMHYSNLFDLGFDENESIHIGFKNNHFVPIIGKIDKKLSNQSTNLYCEFLEKFNSFRKFKEI
ncbi:unnamed protein product [Brachionus calyciflorus]|uniref:OTU domain-containing protein n=1 Tax=Brachionus calyciflorus TaxID=104777 RepID=A0A813XNF8_9BILA|nr:unnamed protein product [Brachionus calyciflorus]